MRIMDLAAKKRLVFDGSMGTMLQRGALTPGVLPETLNITNPEAVLKIHNAYLEAGCDIIKTNTFGANRLKFINTRYDTRDIITSGVKLAKEAVSSAQIESADRETAFIALDIGPVGKLLSPLGELEFDDAVSVFAEVIETGAGLGCDVILFETMNDTYEIKAALIAAKETCSLPVFVTFTPDEHGRLLTGADIQTAVCLIETLGADALGLNCGLGPVQMENLLPALLEYSNIPIIISPNAGLPIIENNHTVFTVSEVEFANQMTRIAPKVQIIGGCCGTTPNGIAMMAKATRDIPHIIPAKTATVTRVSSYGKTVVFGDKPIIIGERINPTGKQKLKKALIENDMEYILKEGLSQTARGASLLDVNAGLAGIDESVVLPRIVTTLQAVTDTPLQIDTTNPKAAERALRLYNGKPLFNSISGKKETLDTFLPIIRKYGASCVALLLDDEGIPATADGRIDIAKKIIEAARGYGISKEDIIIDALTMTISTGADNAAVTLETVYRARNELGAHTVLGVSNVSFGLPAREKINAAFFVLAMSRGLSAAIVNPLSDSIMDAYYTHAALAGHDPNCSEYIKIYGSNNETTPNALTSSDNGGSDTPQLDISVINGLSEQARVAAKRLLADAEPMDIINSHLIPALDKIGKDFESGKVFLPQLLMSAQAASAAFDVIRGHMKKSGQTQDKSGKIILATVKGDIHDIGINIVKALLENYNYDIIDLGKNVEPDLVVKTVTEERVPLVGLSALMTTTLVYMEETIRLLKREAPFCRIMVGGAVLTEDYAEQIGADYYSKDAMGSIRIAQEVFRAHLKSAESTF